MKGETVFCAECRKNVSYTINRKKMTGVLKGETYEYTGKEACCDECKKEIYVPEVNDFNLKALYDSYREKNDIISLENIIEISEKYSICKRPLSKLLGWGEQTFSRYCDGDMPSKQYSDILKRIYEDPRYYNSILEKNQSYITPVSYSKSKEAVSAILTSVCKAQSKIDMVINYLLYRSGDITPLALQKMLYYIQGFYYAFHGKYIFDDDCEAWVHGPVYKDIYDRYSGYCAEPITEKIEFDTSVFTASERLIFDSIIKYIGCYSGKTLEKFTHQETPWLETRGDLPDNESSSRIIKKEDIGQYFTEVKEKYDMLTPGDIKEYAQKMFAQI